MAEEVIGFTTFIWILAQKKMNVNNKKRKYLVGR